MKIRSERDFKAEEMYNLFEVKCTEQIKEWMCAQSNSALESIEDIEDSVDIAKRIVYGRYLLDAVHTVDLNLDEINQAIKIMSDGRTYSDVVDAFIKFGAEPTLQSMTKYFKLVLQITMWYEPE